MSRMNALCIAVVVIVILTISAALAHGDAQWIADGGYMDDRRVLCCNPTDCGVIQPGEVARIPGGWLHIPTNTVLMDGNPGIHSSIDVQMWRCVYGGRMNCLFRPSGA